MGRRCPTGVGFSEDGFVVEAELIAQKLGLSPDAFWREMKRGIVYGVVERGEGDDVGRTRLTFRYRSRSWRIRRNDDTPATCGEPQTPRAFAVGSAVGGWGV
jgi:hypothetical protein